jgi:hypothetical protein
LLFHSQHFVECVDNYDGAGDDRGDERVVVHVGTDLFLKKEFQQQEHRVSVTTRKSTIDRGKVKHIFSSGNS